MRLEQVVECEKRTLILELNAVPLLSGLRTFEDTIGALGRDISDVSRLYDYYSTVETIWTLILNASAFSKMLLTSTKLRGVLAQIKETVFT